MRRSRNWRGKAIAKTYVSGILRLTLLAPEIVEAILDWRQPPALKLNDLLEGFPLHRGGALPSRSGKILMHEFGSETA